MAGTAGHTNVAPSAPGDLRVMWDLSIKPMLQSFVKVPGQNREKKEFAGYLEAIETMERTALAPAFVEFLARGKLLGEKVLFAELQTQLKAGVVNGDQLKIALRAFDALAQAMAAGDPARFTYPTDPSNRARNYLQALASALHR